MPDRLGPIAALSAIASIHAALRAAWMRLAAGIDAPQSGPVAVPGVAGASFLGVGATVAAAGASSRGASSRGADPVAAGGARVVRFLRPAGELVVNRDWRHLAAGLGVGVHRTNDGSGLWNAVKGLWGKGSTKTWVDGRQSQGKGSGYAVVRYEGRDIAVLPWDRDVLVSFPPGVSPVAQLIGVSQSADWVWAGDQVWYHFYRSTVTASSCNLPVIGLPAEGKSSIFRVTVQVRLGNVRWALSKAERDIINVIVSTWGSTGAYGKVMFMVIDWLSGLDPDRGLGKQAQQVFSDIEWEK